MTTLRACILFCCLLGISQAQLPIPYGPQPSGPNFPPVSGTRLLGTFAVAGLPGGAMIGDLALATDGTSGSECTSGGSTLLNWYRWTGSAWALASVGGQYGGTTAFSSITTGTNAAVLHVGTGGSLDASGTGTIAATSVTGLSVASGKTLTASNTLTFTGTDSSSVAFGAGGTAAYTANKLSVFAATTSAELAGVISNETGTGSLVFATSPTFVTPTLGVATATSYAVGATAGVDATCSTSITAITVTKGIVTAITCP